MRGVRVAVVIGLAAACLSGPAAAAEIEGVSFADRVRVADRVLKVHSTGLLRYRVFIKGYVAALYLDEDFAGDATSDSVLGDVPRRIEIEYFWSLPADAFVEITSEGIAEVSGEATASRLSTATRMFNDLYQDIEPGDRYAITYLPGVGTELALNGKPLGVVEGAEFSAALFSLWLGERALDVALRDQLLATP
jgi:hypothetical protein